MLDAATFEHLAQFERLIDIDRADQNRPAGLVNFQDLVDDGFPFFLFGAEDDILHHHLLVPFELGIRRQERRVDGQHLVSVDANRLVLAALRPRAGLPSFPLGRVVCWGRRGDIRFDGGFALFALEAVVLIAQALHLHLSVPQVGGHVFEQVQQPDEELAGSFILDAGEIKVVKHGAIRLLYAEYRGSRISAERLRVKCLRRRVFPNLLRRYNLTMD